MKSRHFIAVALLALCFSLGAQAQQRYEFDQSDEDMVLRCWNMRGITPWILGVTILDEVYSDMAYYTSSEIDRKAITTRFTDGITIVTYDAPFSLSGIDILGAEWVFYKDVLVQMRAGMISDDLLWRHVSRYGQGKGYTEMGPVGNSYYSQERSWKSFDAEMKYVKSVSPKTSSDRNEVGVIVGEDRTVRWYMDAFDLGEYGKAFKAAGGKPNFVKPRK